MTRIKLSTLPHSGLGRGGSTGLVPRRQRDESRRTGRAESPPFVRQHPPKQAYISINGVFRQAMNLWSCQLPVLSSEESGDQLEAL